MRETSLLILSLLFFMSASPVKGQQRDFKLRPGSKQKFGWDATYTATVNEGGKAVAIEVTSKSRMKFTSRSATKEGFEAEALFTTLFLDVSTPGNLFIFLSGKDDPISRALTKMTKQPFRVAFSKTGKVTGISGLSEMIAEACSDAEKPGELKADLENYFGETAIKSLFDILSDSRPGKKEKRGGTFHYKQEGDYFEGVFTLADDRPMIYIVDGMWKVYGEDSGTAIPGVPLSMTSGKEILGTMKSEFTYRADTGWPRKGEVMMDINLTEPESQQNVKMRSMVTISSKISKREFRYLQAFL